MDGVVWPWPWLAHGCAQCLASAFSWCHGSKLGAAVPKSTGLVCLVSAPSSASPGLVLQGCPQEIGAGVSITSSGRQCSLAWILGCLARGWAHQAAPSLAAGVNQPSLFLLSHQIFTKIGGLSYHCSSCSSAKPWLKLANDSKTVGTIKERVASQEPR